jgi:hypothetical protein
MKTIDVSAVIESLQEAAVAICQQFFLDPNEDVELNGVFGPLYFARWQLVAEKIVCSLRDKLPEHLQKEFCDRAIKAISPPRTYH